MIANVFLMAAGKGTRLAPLTDVLPKPAIPVANEPVMGHLLRLLARQGFRRVVSNIAYKADVMKSVFGDGSAWGVDLVWSEEPEPLGTAGGLRYAEASLRRDRPEAPTLILSGDGLHDVDLVALVRAHESAGAVATLALTPVEDASEYGVVIQDGRGLVTGFQEKPAPGTEQSKLANTGIYVFDARIFDLIPARGEFHDFGEDVFPRLLAEGLPVLGVPLPGYWNDIGGLEALREGNFAAIDGRVDTGSELLDAVSQPGVVVHPSAHVSSEAVLIAPVVVGADAVIEGGARISRSVILPGARVPAGSLLAAGTFGSQDGLLAWSRSLAAEAVASS